MYIQECEGWSLGTYLSRNFAKKKAAIRPQSLGVHFKMEIRLNFDPERGLFFFFNFFPP